MAQDPLPGAVPAEMVAWPMLRPPPSVVRFETNWIVLPPLIVAPGLSVGWATTGTTFSIVYVGVEIEVFALTLPAASVSTMFSLRPVHPFEVAQPVLEAVQVQTKL